MPPPELPVADFVRLDVLATLQVVDRAHAVPDAILRHVFTEENAAHTDQGMFGRAQMPNGRMRHGQLARIVGEVIVAHTPIDDLVTLSLPDGIVTEGRHAILREENGRALILARRLAVVTVTTGNENRRMRTLGFRKIEVARHRMPWPAFEHHLLNLISLTLQPSGHPGLQRHAFRKRPDLSAKEITPILLPFKQTCLSVELFKRRLPLRCQFVEA